MVVVLGDSVWKHFPESGLRRYPHVRRGKKCPKLPKVRDILGTQIPDNAIELAAIVEDVLVEGDGGCIPQIGRSSLLLETPTRKLEDPVERVFIADSASVTE